MAARLKLKQILDDKGIAMAKLSRMADISYNTVRDMCADPGHDVKISVLNRIADALEMRVCELLEDERE